MAYGSPQGGDPGGSCHWGSLMSISAGVGPDGLFFGSGFLAPEISMRSFALPVLPLTASWTSAVAIRSDCEATATLMALRRLDPATPGARLVSPGFVIVAFAFLPRGLPLGLFSGSTFFPDAGCCSEAGLGAGFRFLFDFFLLFGTAFFEAIVHLFPATLHGLSCPQKSNMRRLRTGTAPKTNRQKCCQ